LNCIQDTTTAGRYLRQAAGRLGLKGTLVGMATTVDPNDHGVGIARNGDSSVFVVSLTQARLGLPESSPPAKSTCLLLIINQHLSHEEMLEAMSLATEIKVRTADQIGARVGDYPAAPNADSIDCVAIAARGDNHHRFMGRHRILVQLIASACRESLTMSLEKCALATR
jgi:adenosylcobinamide amidohydrolase